MGRGKNIEAANILYGSTGVRNQPPPILTEIHKAILMVMRQLAKNTTAQELRPRVVDILKAADSVAPALLAMEREDYGLDVIEQDLNDLLKSKHVSLVYHGSTPRIYTLTDKGRLASYPW